MHELMEDYHELWTILKGRVHKLTARRRFLFADLHDYQSWVISVTNHGFADALKNRAKWNSKKGRFGQFLFLRTRALVRTELQCEDRFAKAKTTMAKETSVEYGVDAYEELLERDDIEWALHELSSDQLEALSLRYEADLSVTEIARLMERKPNAVSALLHRGRARLEELLEAQKQRVTPEAKRPLRAALTKPRAGSGIQGEEEPAAPLPGEATTFRKMRRSL